MNKTGIREAFRFVPDAGRCASQNQVGTGQSDGAGQGDDHFAGAIAIQVDQQQRVAPLLTVTDLAGHLGKGAAADKDQGRLGQGGQVDTIALRLLEIDNLLSGVEK